MKKNVVFAEDDQVYAKFLIKLKYDGITRNSFFREVVRAYLSEEENMYKFIQSYKDKYKSQSNRLRKIIQKEKNLEKKIGDKFSLSNNEIEDIFDILEQENPDL